jgi:leucyl-tRNA synthetase
VDKIIQEMELFGPDFEQYEQVQAELDRIAEVEREAEVTLVNASNKAPYSISIGKSKAKKERSSRAF